MKNRLRNANFPLLVDHHLGRQLNQIQTGPGYKPKKNSILSQQIGNFQKLAIKSTTKDMPPGPYTQFLIGS